MKNLAWHVAAILVLGIAVSQSAAQSRRPGSSSSSGATNRLASVPHMYGDFGGFGGTNISASQNPMLFLFSDGAPRDYFVQHGSQKAGAGGIDEPIQVMQGLQVIAFSTPGQFGQDVTGDNIADTFPLLIPQSSPLNPTGPSGANLIFQDGKIVFVGKAGPNTETQPVNGTAGDGWNILANYRLDANFGLMSVPNAGASVRVQKIAENNSPMPRDRVFFNYNHFRNVPGDYGDVNRYTAGIEKTFHGGNQSLELRVPFASTLASDQEVNDGLVLKETEFGDATLIWKTMLLENDALLVSGGVGLSLPFADDTNITLNSTPVLNIDNKSFNLLPFFAVMFIPNEQCFAQFFVQIDVDANGNPVTGDILGNNPQTPLGRFHDQTVLFADLSVGGWLYENHDAQIVSGIMPMAELHYATSTNDADRIDGGGFLITSATRRFDQLNATAAVNFELGERLSIRPAVVVPLRAAPNRDFEIEAGVQVNAAF